MRLTIEEIKALIKQFIFKYTKVSIDNDDRHLLCSDYQISLPDFLYVFRDLEIQLQVPIAKVLEQRNYTVFTVNNLTTAITNDFPNILK